MPRAKSNGSDNENSAEYRVFYFEGKNTSSDLSGVLTALGNILKGNQPQIVQQPPRSGGSDVRRGAITSGNGQAALPLDDEEEIIEEAVVTAPTDKAKVERKPFKGEILDTIPWDGEGTPFVPFVKSKSPEDAMKKCLVIATWFKRHGGHESVNANLIYNAYRKMGWTAVDDPGAPLRKGAQPKSGYFKSLGKGQYSVTGIGTDVVDAMTGDP